MKTVTIEVYDKWYLAAEAEVRKNPQHYFGKTEEEKITDCIGELVVHTDANSDYMFGVVDELKPNIFANHPEVMETWGLMD